MRSTGMFRKVDELGRVVIPKELRSLLHIQVKDLIEFFIDNNKIILRKYDPLNACMITGKVSDDNLSLANGRIILSQEVAKKLIQEIEKNL